MASGGMTMSSSVEANLTRRYEGSLWASLPTDLLQAVLSYGDLGTMKAARLVCHGWQSARARLQPSIPLHVHIHQRRTASRHALANARIPTRTGASRSSNPTPATTAMPEPAWPEDAGANIDPAASLELLGWLSRSFHGQLEQEGSVVMTLMERGSAGFAKYEGGKGAVASKRAGRCGGCSRRGGAVDLGGGKVGGDSRGDRGLDTASASGAAGSATNGHPGGVGDGNGGPGGPSPLVAALRHLAGTGQQHLRVQHAASSPAAGMLSASTPCNGRGGIAASAPSAPQLAGALFSGSSVLLHDPNAHPAVPHPVVLPLPACEAPGGCHCRCCCAAAALPPPQRHVHAPGLSAVAALRDLRSLELYGVSFGPKLLRLLTGLTQLTRLCVSLPLPANKATVLASLTTLHCLHFTVKWPSATDAKSVAPPPAAAAQAPGGTRMGQEAASLAEPRSAADGHALPVAAAAAAAPAAAGERMGESDVSGTNVVAAARTGAEGDDSAASGASRDAAGANISRSDCLVVSAANDDGGDVAYDTDSNDSDFRVSASRNGALVMEHIIPSLAALSALPALTDLSLRVSCSQMSRALLSPPALLAEARRACPQLRHFGFRTLSEWQVLPKTLYNWMAAETSDHSVRCIRDDAAGGNQGVFIWQQLDWRLQDPPPPPPLYHGGGGGSGGSNSRALAGGGSGAARAAAAAADGVMAGVGCAAASGGAAAPAPAAADVAASIRTSSSSWLGSCLDATSALDALAGSLPGCRLTSLLLEDSHRSHSAQGTDVEIGELPLRTLEAVSALQCLMLRDIHRPPRPLQPARAQAAWPYHRHRDYVAQLMQLPELTSLELQTTCPIWLDVLLPPAHTPPQPQRNSSPVGPNGPYDVTPQDLPGHGGKPQGGHAADQGTGRSGSVESASLRTCPAGARLHLQQRLLGGPRLQHLSLHVRGLATWLGHLGSDSDSEEEEGPGRAGGDTAVRGPQHLHRLSLLTALRSLHLDMHTVLQMSWLPCSLQHLSLVNVTLLLPLAGSADVTGAETETEAVGDSTGPSGGPRRRPAAGSGGASAEEGRTTAGTSSRRGGGGRGRASRSKRRRRASGDSEAGDGADHAGATGQARAAGLADSGETIACGGNLAACSGDAAKGAANGAADCDGHGHVTAAAAAAPAPAAPAALLPHLATLFAAGCNLPPLRSLLPAAGCRNLIKLALASCRTPNPAGTKTRTSQLLLSAEMDALAACCSLIALRITQPSGLLDVGGSAAAARLLCDAIPRLPRLQALCWEVAAEQQDQLLKCLTGLRELRELAVCEHVGRQGQQYLQQLTGLRCLVQLCTARHARVAHMWMRELAPRMPLCVIKSMPRG